LEINPYFGPNFNPMTFRLLQAVCITLALIGWVIYQMAVKKKTLASLQHDILAIVFFAAVWLGIYYFLIR
jgi:hypothetical protein